MEYVEDLKWEKGITVKEFSKRLSKVGFQSVELGRATDVIVKMKKEGGRNTNT